MSLENLVPDLPSCQKLPRGMETLFKWVYNPIAENYFIVLTSVGEITLSSDAEFYPAPTVQELLKLLPIIIKLPVVGSDDHEIFELRIMPVDDDAVLCQYYCIRGYSSGGFLKIERNSNLAQALADLYNWCVDNGHIGKGVGC